jgi:hypothetical protein
MLYQRDFVPVVAGAASVNKSSSLSRARAGGRRRVETAGARSVHRGWKTWTFPAIRRGFAETVNAEYSCVRWMLMQEPEPEVAAATCS